TFKMLSALSLISLVSNFLTALVSPVSIFCINPLEKLSISLLINFSVVCCILHEGIMQRESTKKSSRRKRFIREKLLYNIVNNILFAIVINERCCDKGFTANQ